MKKVLQMTFKINPQMRESAVALFQKSAPKFNPVSGTVKGIQWKLWLFKREENSGSGIYLFQDEESVMAYLNGELIKELKNHPAISNIETKIFDIQMELSKITNGPVD